ncbi:leucine-rich repeat protein [Methylococcaceae bacterium WWC4]|nr:leucine-rich repeat protein [Methylococcaceae bacterium WWC4]
MNSATNENFKIDTWGRWSIVWVHENAIEDALQLFRQKVVDGFGISPYIGFKGHDLSFLYDIDDQFGLVLPVSKGFLCQEIVLIKSLKFLAIGGKDREVLDFSDLSNLESLAITWIRGDKLPKAGPHLKELSLRECSLKSKDFNELPEYISLEKLRMVGGNIVSLSGIEKYKLLRKSEFYYMRNLKDISALNQCDEVDELHFEGCKKIANIQCLEKCENLRTLKYIDCGEIQSLSILNSFKALDFFAFVKTDVIDGDMTPLFRLKYAGFLNKRSYSHTFEQVSEIQQQG